MQLTYDYMLVKIEEGDKISKGGIILSKPKESKVNKARVLQIGPNVKPVELVGKRILIHNSAGLEIEDLGHLIKQENIFAVLEEGE